ncbi:cytochrome d ubiquinol oxidase subunit II [Gulosibacter molinativorax]|uniref:Cytochrome d ubiquinol oxidase subunit II n=1 Tax=Gulosibacter molinativorax TaxID=256821 RepID=A0ABT7C8V7_9MICO|nr:cytochrome d ubiquinol oxidase subunit II [Gulosibacter molinativorax]MDJ1371617.1 cytochrome d ubiquinol oxidase subunit II [Gulosibacter molinativorax]QUY61040.1 Cytochrome bd oxidase subunit 2 [Gulosibacter molinativorax]
MDLPTLWFVVIAVLWFGYLMLESFDMGVLMHFFGIARTPTERRVLLNTIGPVWDGNEVWLIVAGAATFAAFPYWYASLFSGLYIPLVFALFALIVRAIAIEYRSKHHTERWTATWDRLMAIASLLASFLVGALLAVTTTGLPLNENGDRVGGPWAWFSWPAVIGGLALVGFSLIHGANFLALRTEGELRERSRAFVLRWTPLLILPLLAWVIIVQVQSGSAFTWTLVVLAAIALVAAYLLIRAKRQKAGFITMGVFLAFGVAAIFAAVFPVVLPSTIDPAFNLTVWNAASGDYTLGVMTVIALLGLPAVIITQAWSYRTFSKRLATKHIPEIHEIVPAVRKK